MSEAEMDPTTPILLGAVVGGRYRIVSRLGGGAMGDVFEAENVSIRLRVAVKILKPSLADDPTFRERFREEAQAIAAIEHPGVIRFLDLVVGTPTFLVMEHVRGPTLAEVVRDRRVGMGDALRVAARLCDALSAAHQVGVVHRDLKPTNVLLARGPEGVQPKLIDFGLAKIASRAGERTGLTRTGQVVGTPRYMAPEQITGGSVDARTDLYALGCLLYELLSGAAPFEGDEDLQVLYRQVHDKPRPLDEMMPGLPPAIARIVARLLEKEPRRRFADAIEARLALEEAMALLGDAPELYALDEEMSTTALRAGAVPLAVDETAPSGPTQAYTAAAGGAPLLLGSSASATASASASGRSSRRRARLAIAAARALEAANSGRAAPSPAPPPAPPRARGRMALVAVAALAAGAVGGALFGARLLVGERSAGATQGGGALLLVSDPAGARVLVDDKPQPERTPTWAAGLPAGAHRVRFERDGVAPLEQTVTLREGERALVQVALPTPRRQVEVRSVPDGAQVFLDGRLVLGETPVTLSVEQDDFHEVRVVKSGWQTEVRALKPEDSTTQLVVTLARETQPRGTLYVDANGAAEIWIDGKPSGYTTPSLGIYVPAGRHMVELRDGGGGRSAPTVVTVAQGETVRLAMGALVPAADPADAPATPSGAKVPSPGASKRHHDLR